MHRCGGRVERGHAWMEWFLPDSDKNPVVPASERLRLVGHTQTGLIWTLRDCDTQDETLR